MSGTVNYYDYSEPYECQDAVEPSSRSVPTGIVRHIKTIIEEWRTPEPVSRGTNVSIGSRVNENTDELGPCIPELPASPVPRRITRDIVLAGLGPESSSGEVEVTGATTEGGAVERSTEDGQDEHTTAPAGNERRLVQSTNAVNIDNRYSILSQAGSSVMESSTLEFAVRCSIPLVADKGVILDINDKTASIYSPDMEPTSEDGMTDLLEGYQRTETKDGSEKDTSIQIDDTESGEKKSNHAAKSSDEQSFKSCTDAVIVEEPLAKEIDAKSFKSCVFAPGAEPPVKDSDAKSFKTCKDAVTPDRIASLPVFAPPSVQVPKPELFMNRPFTEMSLSSPLFSERKAALSSTSDSSMPRAVGRIRASSILSSTQGTVSGSFSSLKEYGSHTPPAVPPRESSSSREAQQSRGVANFLLRSVRQRFTKASPGSNLRPSKENKHPSTGELNDSSIYNGIPTPPPMKERTLTANAIAPSGMSLEAPRAPQRALTKEGISTHWQSDTDPMPEHGTRTEDHKMTPTTTVASYVRPTMSRTPSPVVPEASSVYSPDGVSLVGPYLHESSIVSPKTPIQYGHDSQTTTHLSWTNGPVSHQASIDRSRVARTSQEDSTTDLRLPGCRHAVTHLPDLKEESHEDSSLNTSASNFRPLGGSQPAVFCVSTDDVALSRRYPSVRSSRNSVLQQIHLPSMNFSSFGSFDEALDHRVSRSLELVPAVREELAQVVTPRSASAGEGRDKYKSVFAGLDTPAKTSAIRQNAGGDLWMRKSPDLFMREVDSLTIPSVNGLTTRLSEMLPKLKEALGLAQADEFPDEEGIMEKTMERLNEVGLPAQKRSSARLRPVPGSPNMLVVDDEVFKEIAGTSEDNAPTSRSLNRTYTGTGRNVAPSKSSYIQHEATALTQSGVGSPSDTHDSTKINTAELEAPSPAHLRHKNPHFFLPPTLTSPSSQPSTGSLRSGSNTPTATATDTRPWNLDKNYPWATDPSVDISLPPPSISKHSPRPGPSHLRNRLSSASTESTGTSSPFGTSTSPPARRETTGYCYNFNLGGRRSAELSALCFDASGYPIAPVRVREEDQSHGAGERYPTSALPMPSNLHFYPGQASNFSLDTSDEEPETTSARKNLFKRRPRRAARTSTNHHELSQGRIRELQDSQATESTSQEVPDDIPDRSRRQTFSDAKGMSKVGYLMTKCRLSVQKHWSMVRDAIFPCFAEQESLAGPSNGNTISATSRASSSTEETQAVDQEPSQPTRVLGNGPGRRYKSRNFVSFPEFFSSNGHSPEAT